MFSFTYLKCLFCMSLFISFHVSPNYSESSRFFYVGEMWRVGVMKAIRNQHFCTRVLQNKIDTEFLLNARGEATAYLSKLCGPY